MTTALRRDLNALLRRAGDHALTLFREVSAEVKDDGTHVTEADRQLEEILVEGLRRLTPGASITSEEGTRESGGSATWYVDPIDGTSSFLEGLAHWGPTVALVEDGVVQVGALWLPRLGELWHGERGEGAWRGDARLPRVDAARPVDRNDALALPSRFHWRQPLAWRGKSRCLGSTASHLALTSAGSFRASLVPRWEVWDIACGLLLLEETGQGVVDLAGRAYLPLVRPGEPFWAGHPAALAELTPRPFPSRGDTGSDPSKSGDHA